MTHHLLLKPAKVSSVANAFLMVSYTRAGSGFRTLPKRTIDQKRELSVGTIMFYKMVQCLCHSTSKRAIQADKLG